MLLKALCAEEPRESCGPTGWSYFSEERILPLSPWNTEGVGFGVLRHGTQERQPETQALDLGGESTPLG